ncbi:MAG: hypothetical protein M3Y21_07385 [Candidatus Eremiobacteraeota bacterium]|nr:hypothetical protein [Candidatus Eremiobacteraeota bacterium]
MRTSIWFSRFALVLISLVGVCFGCAAAGSLSGDAPDGSVVWLSGGKAPAPVTAEMRNTDRSFQPDSLVVPVGSSVRFPNDDPYYHSIYSGGAIDSFDIGYYGNGPGKLVSFDHSGVVIVRCHIHRTMRAVIFVVDGPSARASKGTFTIDNVPTGNYTLHIANTEGDDQTSPVVVR